MYGSDAGQPVPSLYTKGLSPLCDKEYQARGAPHYHILLWIDEAPVAGTSSDDEVLQWIQARITCRIPEENSNPELHQLVTKYQHHKCNSYCQRKKRVWDTFITRCRFRFPRQECSTAECMKLSHRKMYTLPRSPEEIRHAMEGQHGLAVCR